MSYDFYGVMEGTRITGVLRVNTGEPAPPGMTTTLLTDWVSRPPPENAYAGYHLISGVITSIDPRALSVAQATQLSILRDNRETVVNNTFVWDGSVFDANLTARSRLAALKIDSLDLGFVPRAWRLADNTWRTLSASDVAGVWNALRTHTEAQYATFKALETEVFGSLTNSEVLSVTWPE